VSSIGEAARGVAKVYEFSSSENYLLRAAETRVLRF